MVWGYDVSRSVSSFARAVEESFSLTEWRIRNDVTKLKRTSLNFVCGLKHSQRTMVEKG